jgi:hypothetical protein
MDLFTTQTVNTSVATTVFYFNNNAICTVPSTENTDHVMNMISTIFENRLRARFPTRTHTVTRMNSQSNDANVVIFNVVSLGWIRNSSETFTLSFRTLHPLDINNISTEYESINIPVPPPLPQDNVPSTPSTPECSQDQFSSQDQFGTACCSTEPLVNYCSQSSSQCSSQTSECSSEESECSQNSENESRTCSIPNYMDDLNTPTF